MSTPEEMRRNPLRSFRVFFVGVVDDMKTMSMRENGAADGSGCMHKQVSETKGRVVLLLVVEQDDEKQNAHIVALGGSHTTHQALTKQTKLG